MGGRFAFRWLIGFAMIAALAGVAFYSYNLGVAQGVAESARIVAAPGVTGGPVVIWPGPWGYGFGLFPFFPFLFILFWLFVLRGLFWRRAWWGRGYGCGYGGVPPAFDELHRHAHGQQGPPPASPVNL